MNAELGRITAIRREHRTLVRIVNRHNYLYYELGQPEISDNQYDKLYAKLVRLEERYAPYLDLLGSPTQKVGYKVSAHSKKVTHPYQMLSIMRTNKKELVKFIDKFPSKTLVIEPKLDGIAVEACYKSGKIHTFSTRGNGVIGEDIKHNIDLVSNIPLTLSTTDDIVVHGELVVTKEEFSHMRNMFSSPRHMVAGNIRVKHRDETRLCKNLLFLAYRIYAPTTNFHTYVQEMEYASSLGFSTMPRYVGIFGALDVITMGDKMLSASSFEMDGIVCKYDSIAIRDKAGQTLKFPKWMAAYKFEASPHTATVQSITFQVGRSGVITPVAELEPLSIGRRTIKRVTLHNVRYLLDQKINCGSRVHIKLVGDAIPVISRVENKHDNDILTPPHICMSCQSSLIWSDSKAHLVCLNGWNCPHTAMARINHFAGRNASNIQGLSEKTIEQLVNLKLVQEFSDLYKLTAQDLAQLSGFKEKKINNLLASIRKSANFKLANFIYALGIEGVGLGVARTIAKNISTDTVVQDLKSPTFLPDGAVKKSVEDFFQQNYNVVSLGRLLSYVDLIM